MAGERDWEIRVPYIVNIVLVENSTHGKERGVGLNLKRLRGIWNKTDRILHKAELEVGEGVVAFGGPKPGCCLL